MGFRKHKSSENLPFLESDSPYRVYSDQELWSKFCAGDQLAFALIYKRFAGDLYNFGYQLSRDKDLSKDIIQDLFVRLRFSQSKTKVKSIKSYLFKCFQSEWIKQSKAATSFAPLSESFSIVLSFEDNIVESQQGEERLDYLKEALQLLTPKQRQGIMLYFYEGLSYEEVSEAMSLKNAKSARKLIYRSLERLKPNEVVMKIIYSFLL